MISITKGNVYQSSFICRNNYKEQVVSHCVGREEELKGVVMSGASAGGHQMSGWGNLAKSSDATMVSGSHHKLLWPQ